MVVIRGKCVVIGDSCVGKTAVIHSFQSDGTSYPKNYTMTTNVDVISKFIRLGRSNREIVDMFLFDTSGKSVYKEMTELHFDKVGMFVIVFDVSDRESFSNCDKWLKQLKSYMDPHMTIPGVLLGNKIDLDKRRLITADVAKMFASKHGLEYFECSAKEFVGIEAPFRWLADKFYKLYSESHDLVQQMEY